jgi:hypothetical protein
MAWISASNIARLSPNRLPQMAEVRVLVRSDTPEKLLKLKESGR